MLLSDIGRQRFIKKCFKEGVRDVRVESQEELEVQQLCEPSEQVEGTMRQQSHNLEVVRHYVFQQVDCTLADYLPALIAFAQANCINHSSRSSFTKLHPSLDEPSTFPPPLIHIAAPLIIVVTYIALLLIFFCVLNGL